MAIFGLHPLTPWKLTYPVGTWKFWLFRGHSFIFGGKNPFKNPGGLGLFYIILLSTSRLFHTCRIDNSGELLESFLESFHEAMRRWSSGRSGQQKTAVPVQGEVVWFDFWFPYYARKSPLFEKFWERILKVMGHITVDWRFERGKELSKLSKDKQPIVFFQQTRTIPVTRAKSPPVS